MESPEQKHYEVAGRKFYQGVPVAMQLRQLVSAVKGVEFDLDSFDPQSLISVFSDTNMISRVIAIVIREEGKKLKEKNVDELADFIEENMPAEMVLQVISDFFSLNDILTKIENYIRSGKLNSLISRIQGMMEEVNKAFPGEKSQS